MIPRKWYTRTRNTVIITVLMKICTLNVYKMKTNDYIKFMIGIRNISGKKVVRRGDKIWKKNTL